MPLPPSFATAITNVTGSVYTTLAKKLANHKGEVYSFHVGDTWMEPAEGCRMEDLRVEEFPGMHRYTAPQGHPELLSTLREELGRRHEWDLSRDQILIAAGATGALGAVAGAILDPGDEVLLAAPYWPLIAGIVRSFRGVSVPVPIFAPRLSGDDIIAALETATTDKTVAVYWNTPNNPSGMALTADEVAAICAWAQGRNLWILADEVYEAYQFADEVGPAFSLAPERTFSTHSFSKTYGMAGNRCGYVVGPGRAISAARKISTHTFYSTPTASQLAATRTLTLPAAFEWVDSARAKYQEVGSRCAEMLGVPAPQGSTFLFVDVGDCLGDTDSADNGPKTGLNALLEDLADLGLFLAPGPSFGPYPHHVRMCFTATPPDVTLRGCEILARELDRRRS